MIRASLQLQRGDFSLDVAFQSSGGVTGVFGPSGAGKSTLIALVAGLLRPDQGLIEVNGTPILDRSRGIDVPAHRRQIGVVFQEHRLFPHYSVRGNLEYGRRPSDAELSRVVQLLQLGPLLTSRIQQLSGGERQRVALGRALLSRPRLLLLDEPLASLDQRLKHQISRYLRLVRDEWPIPMLYVSHDLVEILQLTDDILFLDRGKSVGHGTYTEVIHREGVIDVVHDRGLTNVLAARVLENHAEDGISLIELLPPADSADTLPARLVAPLCPSPAGSRILISIQPWEIALASSTVSGISIQNQVHGSVTRCTNHGRSVLVDVQIGPHVLVEISPRSMATLNIGLNRPIVCLVKAQAIQFIGEL